jgi:hypothetical protein
VEQLEEEEEEEHVQQMKSKPRPGIRSKAAPQSKDFVNQVQKSISASRKYKQTFGGVDPSHVNNVNSKRSPVMPQNTNRIASHRKSAKEFDTDEETNNLLAVEASNGVLNRYQEEENSRRVEPEQMHSNPNVYFFLVCFNQRSVIAQKMTTYSITITFKSFNVLLQLISYFLYKKRPITVTVDYYNIFFNLTFIFLRQ